MTELRFAACPFVRHRGRLAVVLITARRSGCWLLPKGRPEIGMNGRAVAKLEAWEEAGIVGPVNGPCGRIRIGIGERARRVSVYVQRVDRLRSTYPEDHQRKRRVVPLDELEDVPMLDAWKQVIRRLARAPQRR